MINKKQLDRILLNVEKPARYVGSEINSIIKNKEDVDARFVFAFPDIYEVGMSHLGMHILYNLINSRENIWCERTFAPWIDMEEEMRKNDIPLYALESKDSIREFDMVGFTLQYEMSYTNILNMLDLGNIPLRSSDRNDELPLVIAGGPCAFNPEPLWEIIDLFVIGEAEEVFVELLDIYINEKKKGYTKLKFLEKAAQLEGVYVPQFYNVLYNNDGTIKERKVINEAGKEIISKRIIKDMDKVFYPEKAIIPYIDIVHDRVMLEVFRGCTRGCRFCQAGMIYRPVREKSVDTLIQQSEKLVNATGHEEISLASLSTGDYKNLPELACKLLDKYESQRIGLSLPSLRLDSISYDLIERIQKVRKSGLTFAPEAGTQRMRDVINKNITEEDILSSVKSAFDLGWSTVKLYFMIGLPTETEEDILGIKNLAYEIKDLFFKRPKEKIKGNLKITVSASCFVPKPFTPFQWLPQNDVEQFYSKAKLLSKEIKDRKITYNYHDPKLSYLEAVFARGDRKLSKALIRAWEKGCKFDGWGDKFDYNKWIEVFEETNISHEFYTVRERSFDEILPWDFINAGVDKEFLIKEYENSKLEQTTSDCRQGCKNCGINKKIARGIC